MAEIIHREQLTVLQVRDIFFQLADQKNTVRDVITRATDGRYCASGDLFPSANRFIRTIEDVEELMMHGSSQHPFSLESSLLGSLGIVVRSNKAILRGYKEYYERNI